MKIILPSSQSLPYLPTPLTTPTHNRYEALANTAATHTFLEDEATPFCTEISPAPGPEFQVTNGQSITPHIQATMPLAKELSKKA